MSIMNAMNAGVSGLASEGDALSIVGDNVANANTVGFKRARAQFESVLGGAVGSERGGGVMLARSQQIFAQGSIQQTGQATDVALSGDGFFVVKGSVGGVTGDFYTRDGQFSLDSQNRLVNGSGMEVQGYAANADGTFGTTMGPISPRVAIPPKATKDMKITANLDAAATPPAQPWDPQNPGATSNLSTSMTMYDSLGKAHEVNVYFRNTGPGQWEYHALAKGGDVAGGTPNTNVEIGTGNLAFTTGGALQSTSGTTGTVSFNGAGPNQPFSFDFGKDIAGGGDGLGGITQFGSPSQISAQSQDGFAAGELQGVKVDDTGAVLGVYSNGQTLASGKLAIAKFASNEGLGRAGKNMWISTRDSGDAAIGVAGTGGRGAVAAGALEGSNVDIATEFVGLISHQRAFSANSKTITTADQMLQELMTIKQ